MEKIDKYIEELMEKSTPQAPMWNIEVIRAGKKAKWDYIDGCMIKAFLEMYAITGDERYLTFSDNYIGAKIFTNFGISMLNTQKNATERRISILST